MSNNVRYNKALTTIFDELEKNINNALSFYPMLASNLFNTNTSKYWLPNIDIKEEDKFYQVTVDVPGVEKDKIKISVDQYNNLVIEGERDSEEKKESKGCICLERQRGEFLRKISFPGLVEAQGIKASCRNGVLEINIPKSSENVVKKIDIE